MAAAFPIPLTAAQLGTYFVGQYYQVLQQQPEIVHQFYSDASTMLRIDGHIRESATAMLQIHTLVMSSNFVGVEIKTINSLESWNGGLLVIISGSVRQKNFSGNRKFVQTFFLAPQEKGLFILNDVFHFVEEDQIQHNPAVLLAQNNLNVKLSASTTNQETVASYGLGGEVETRDFTRAKEKENNGPVDNYMLQEQVSESENFHEDSVGAETNGPTQDAVQERTSTSVDEAAGEPQKHTYASILRVAKGQSAASVAVVSKNVPHPPVAASEWDPHPPPPPEHSNQQQHASPNTYERSGVETAEEVSGVEDEGYDVKSVYVRNLPSTVSESEIEEEFSKFGRIIAEGVVIRGRKDMGVCYAFVEFEDMVGVQNAVKAGSAHIAGRQAYIEERRPNNNNNNNNSSRGRKVRGGRQQSEAPRGRFRPSRTFGGGDNNREYNNNNRSRGYNYNGFHRSNSRQPSSGGGGGGEVAVIPNSNT